MLTVALSLLACDREIEQDILSVNPPELHVYVEDEGGSSVANATVSIYDTKEDLNNGTNPMITKTADGEGRMIATGEELGDPGIYYLRAESGPLSGTGATPYLLLNDGHTRFELVIQ